MGAPLTVEVTAMTGRLEMLEKNRKVTLQGSLHFGDDVHSAWGNIAKTEVFSGLPDVEFTQITIATTTEHFALTGSNKRGDREI